MANKITSQLKKLENKNIEIIFTLPAELISETKTEVLNEISKDVTIQGFRKGMAPIAKVEASLSSDTLTQHILSHLLPKAFADSVSEHKFNPAIYPKFEIVKVGQGSEWEIKAITCELPEVKLGNYLKEIKKVVSQKKDAKNIEDLILTELPKVIKIELPEILIQEEVDNRLSQLLARIEKLGLQLEGYLASVGKNIEKLRDEYVEQAKNSISLELILNQIGLEEKIEVNDKDLEEFVKTTGSDFGKINDEQKQMLKRIVIRRKALEKIAKEV